MPRLAIYLLGSLKFNLEGMPRVAFRTDKARALLVFLAVEDGLSHSRDALAAMLWPDRPTASARANLRQELYSLRKILDDQESSNPYFLVSPDNIQFNPESDFYLDVAEYMSLVQLSRAHHPDIQTLCVGCLEKLEAAISLYQGDFLGGFSLTDCPSYDWWQLNRQEVYHQTAMDTLTWLGNYYESRRDHTRMGNYAKKKVELEPWRESAHRQLMRALALDGQRCRALRQYEICRNILTQELGVEPAAETTLLYDLIRMGKLLPRDDLADKAAEYSPFVSIEHDLPPRTSLTKGNCGSEHVKVKRRLPVALTSRVSLAEQYITTKPITITEVHLLKPGGIPVQEIFSGEPLWIEIEYAATKTIRDAVFGLSIVTQDGQVCFESSTKAVKDIPLDLRGAGKIRVQIDRLELMEGQYYIDLAIHQSKMLSAYDYHRHLHTLSVLPSLKSKGVLHPPHRWECIR